MQKRVQSPSSIKCYKHCPRKYYYAYIQGIRAPPNIHQVRGHIVHSVLERFFDIDIDTSLISLNDFEVNLKLKVQKLLVKEWQAQNPKIKNLNLSKEQEIFYFEESLLMLLSWVEYFCNKLSREQGSFQERFKRLTPLREQIYKSEALFAKGIIDAIETDRDGHIRLMDYKTSASQDLNEHILQLAIYSLLYFEKHGKMPKHAGVYFLKGEEKVMNVDEKLLELAKKEIEFMHENTKSVKIEDYPKCPGPLCKWETGKCEYFDICKPFETKKEPHSF